MVGQVNANATSVLNGQSGALSAGGRIADDFDSFLLLLTTQLQNQDPLEPLDTNEFTSQLVQFASVEQQIAQNTNLESLIGLSALDAQVTSLGYINKEVTAIGSQGYLKDGAMKFRVASTAEPEEITITILGPDGETVKTYNPEATGEPIDLVWDGKNNDGVDQENGIYTIRVDAKDGEGVAVETFVAISGTVTSVRSGPNNEILVSIEDLLIDTANILAVGALDGKTEDKKFDSDFLNDLTSIYENDIEPGLDAFKEDIGWDSLRENFSDIDLDELQDELGDLDTDGIQQQIQDFLDGLFG